MSSLETRIKALAAHLGCDSEDIAEGYDDTRFEYGRKEYCVLTDAEADDACAECIAESLWAFNTSFLRAHVAREHQAALDALDAVRGRLCEDANPLVLALIKDFDHLVADAVRADGRGHFLNSYDGEEGEARVDGETFYIYRA